METRIVFKDMKGQEDLIEDLESAFVESLNLDNDDELQEAWIQHGHHANSWSWKRICTNNDAPWWNWTIIDTLDQVLEIKNEISEMRKQMKMPDQISSFNELQDYVDYLESGLKQMWHALPRGQKIWIAQDDDGYHLGVHQTVPLPFPSLLYPYFDSEEM